MIINQVVFSNNMDLFRKIENDIKTGNIAYHLNKPYYYPSFMLFDSLGKIILSFSVNLIFGVTLGLLFLGTIPSITLINLIPILTMMLLGIILNTVIYILISMTSFWFEENRPFVWIYRQLIFAFGGFLVPLTLFPKGLYNVMINMPWSYVSYHTSSNAVKFSFNGFLNTVCWQVFYIGLVFLLIIVTFKKGAEKLNVNGG
jgi:ABC-2 type transport system permease protein